MSHILIKRSCPTVTIRLRVSSKFMATMLCFASWKVANEARLKKNSKLNDVRCAFDITYSMSCSTMWHGSHTRTLNSNPIIGIGNLAVEQRSQTAFPQWRQWCCRNPSCRWSIIARRFQKKGLPHNWQASDSTHSGVSLLVFVISQNTNTPSSPALTNCLLPLK